MQKYLILSKEEKLIMYIVDDFSYTENGGIRLSPKFQIAPNVAIVQVVQEVPDYVEEYKYKYIDGEYIKIEEQEEQEEDV